MQTNDSSDDVVADRPLAFNEAGNACLSRKAWHNIIQPAQASIGNLGLLIRDVDKPAFLPSDGRGRYDPCPDLVHFYRSQPWQ
jgi:hypothetical protein